MQTDVWAQQSSPLSEVPVFKIRNPWVRVDSQAVEFYCGTAEPRCRTVGDVGLSSTVGDVELSGMSGCRAVELGADFFPPRGVPRKGGC
eukprot:gene19987-biopygen23526